MWEVHIERFISIGSYQSSNHVGKQAQPIDLWPIDRSEIFLKKNWAASDTSAKERGKVHQYHLLSPRYPHIPVLQPWQIRATSMLSWEAGRKGSISSSYHCLYLPLSAALLRSYQISFLYIQQQFGYKICCYLGFTNGYLCWYQRVSLLDLHGFFILLIFSDVLNETCKANREVRKVCITIFLKTYFSLPDVYFTVVDIDLFILCIIYIVVLFPIPYSQSCRKMHVALQIQDWVLHIQIKMKMPNKSKLTLFFFHLDQIINIVWFQKSCPGMSFIVHNTHTYTQTAWKAFLMQTGGLLLLPSKAHSFILKTFFSSSPVSKRGKRFIGK